MDSENTFEMNTIKRSTPYWTFLIPIIYVSIIFRNAINASFGLADDHLHFEANIASQKSFLQYFHFYFQLQPWGQTPRFNPSQLMAWTIESTLFGTNPLGWRLVQLLAVLISGIAIGIAARNFGLLLNFTPRKTLYLTVLSQALFLSLPFWSETIGRIGAPETLAAVVISLMLLNVSIMITNPSNWLNHVFLAVNTVLLIGFKENLILVVLCSVFAQVIFLYLEIHKRRFLTAILLILQVSATLFVVLGFLPELISSGQEVNGAGIGLSRLIIGKWVMVPAISLFISLFALYSTSERFRREIIIANFCLSSLVVIEYFIMAGRLGGHYGFLSGVFLAIQTVITVAALEKFKKLSLISISTLIVSGLIFNLTSTKDYFTRTIQFKNEIVSLESIQESKLIQNIVIIASKEEHYEAVSSIISFNFKPKLTYFLLVTNDFPEGALRESLTKFSSEGNANWHITPIDQLRSRLECVAVVFSETNQFDQCEEKIAISWLGA